MNRAKSCSFVFVFITLIFLLGCESSGSSDLLISPKIADFDEVTVDDDKDLELTITNTSGEPLTLIRIELENDTEFEIKSGNTNMVNLGIDEKHKIVISFSSHTAGKFTDILIIKHSASSTPKKVSLVSVCKASTAMNVLAASPSKVDFGDVNIGDSSKLDVMLLNKYNKTIILTSCVIVGSSDFVITAGDHMPVSLVKGATHKLTIQFMPTSVGTINAQIKILHDATFNPVTIDVKGSGVPVPRIVLTETSYDFGNKLIGGTYYHDFEIENVGTADIDISALDLLGSGASAYAITNSATPFSIHPGSKHTISVSFNPSALGDYEAELRITHNAINEPTPYSIDIKGFGALSGPNIAFNYTTTLDFGNVSMSNPSVETVEIRNIGTDPFILISILVSLPTEFKIDVIKDYKGNTTNVPIMVNPGEKIFVHIKFTPTSTTTFNSSLVIIHNATNEPTPYDIKLTGVGTN